MRIREPPTAGHGLVDERIHIRCAAKAGGSGVIVCIGRPCRGATGAHAGETAKRISLHRGPVPAATTANEY